MATLNDAHGNWQNFPKGKKTMIIRKLRVRNYMIHRDSSIEFPPVTVLVGSNAGGKSALFEALINFSMVARGPISQAFGPWPFSFYARKHHGAASAARIRFEATLAESSESIEALDYFIEYAQHGNEGDLPFFVIYNERLQRQDSENVLFDRTEPDLSPLQSALPFIDGEKSVFAAIRGAQIAGTYKEYDSLVTYCAKQISRINKFRLEPTLLSRPGRLPDVSTEPGTDPHEPRIDHKGEDLASVLYYLSETAHPALQKITQTISNVLDNFEGFSFNAVGADRIAFSARFSDSRAEVPAVHLSDGALALIGLIVLVYSPGRPAILCIEEPENGLTPKAMKAFYSSVRDLAFNPEQKERSQIILSSHSPFVICEAWNGEDRDFIYQVKPKDGQANIRQFKKVIEDEGIHLQKDGHGGRSRLSINTADRIMAGYWS